MTAQPELSFAETPERAALRERYEAAHALLREMEFSADLAYAMTHRPPKLTRAEAAAQKAEKRPRKKRAAKARQAPKSRTEPPTAHSAAWDALADAIIAGGNRPENSSK